MSTGDRNIFVTVEERVILEWALVQRLRRLADEQAMTDKHGAYWMQLDRMMVESTMLLAKVRA